MAPLSELDPDPLGLAQLEIAEVFGNIADFWGFTRTQGRIFGLLFTSHVPLSHGTIRDRLSISAGSASMTLASLLQWGVVHRRGRHYWAETDFWKLITGVMGRREHEQVEDAIARVHRVQALLTDAPGDDPPLEFARERVDHLLDFFRLGRTFLRAFVAQDPVHRLLSTIARTTRAIPRRLLERHGTES